MDFKVGMWPVRAFWGMCGVFTVNLTRSKSQYVYSVLLMATCVYNFVYASPALCKLEHWCVVFSSAMVGMYTRVLASTTFLSRVIIMVQSERSLSRYKGTVGAFEEYAAASTAERRSHDAFSLAVVVLCLAIILPSNVCRLYFLYTREPRYDTSLLVYYLFIYAQNLSMCCIETQFVAQCFVVLGRFRDINGDLERLSDENLDRAKYPFMAGQLLQLQRRRRWWWWTTPNLSDEDTLPPPPPHSQLGPRFMNHPAADTVELLRIKHWLTRQAVELINSLFGMHMGLSVILLWVMSVFDIYYEIYRDSPAKILVYGWLLQYSFRMFMIILVAHHTTKQAMKSKSLILDTNNQMLDSSIKEELLLFVNQICHHSTEFTAYDFFTLNTQVIKSAIAAGTTYLVILVQFHA